MKASRKKRKGRRKENKYLKEGLAQREKKERIDLRERRERENERDENSFQAISGKFEASILKTF